MWMIPLARVSESLDFSLKSVIATRTPKESKTNLVGGFNPFEKYSSNWKSSPNRGEHKKNL